jgi:uncharacterized protein YfaS (alpha-2-macroglobulin family)
MVSPDANAVRLLLLASEQGLWKEDAPRILRGVVARRQGGAWETTVANAWGVVAMRSFAKAFEGEKVSGRTEASLAGRAVSVEWTSATPPPILLPWPPSASDLRLRHDGAGKPWTTVTSKAALPVTAPVAAGYRITKTTTPVEPRTPGTLSRGDRLRVVLDIEAQRPMWWVAIDDPVPAGTSHLGSGLGRGADLGMGAGAAGSGVAADEDWIAPEHVERSHESWRAYLRYLPQGHSRVEYAIRVNQPGTFRVPPTRIEALYAPELFGEIPNAIVKVEP